MKLFKKIFFLLTATFITIGLSLGISEVLVRIFYPHVRDHVMPAGMFDMDDYLGWKLRAGKSGRHHSRYFNVMYSINSLGFRDLPRLTTQSKNTYQIFLYGDSQIFGWGLPEEQRFSNLIENSRKNIEIWNLAVPGYGLDQQILSYKNSAHFLNADGVIFFVSSPTLTRTQYNYLYRKYKPMFTTEKNGDLKLLPVPTKNTSMTDVFYNILSPFYLPYFVELRFATLMNILHDKKHSVAQQPARGIGVSDQSIGNIQKQMLIMARDLTNERNHKLFILSHLPETMEKSVQDFCQQYEIDLVEINFDNNDHLVHGKYDKHWNSLANKKIATLIQSCLEKNFTLD